MGKRTIVLVVALLLAAVSAFSVWQYLNSVEDEVRRDINEIKVFRANEFIEQGTPGEEAKLVIEESIALQEVLDLDEDQKIICAGENAREGEDPDPTVCQGHTSSLDIDGKVAAGPINAGQLITDDMFLTPQEVNSITLSQSIPQGKVAISFRAPENNSVGGFVRPGDKVNILASASVNLSSAISLLQDPELRELILESGIGVPTDTGVPGVVTGEEEQQEDAISRRAAALPSTVQFTQTVLQNIEVLAVGADTRDAPLGTGLEPQGTQIVVLEVTPEQAEIIEFADQFTSVSLSLLPDPDEFPYTEFEARGVLVEDLFDLIPRIQEILEPLEGLLGN